MVWVGDEAGFNISRVECTMHILENGSSAQQCSGQSNLDKVMWWALFMEQRCVSCPLVRVRVLVHFHFNLVSSVLAPFQIG